MASGYHSTVKKYLDQNKLGCSLPDYIQRGWNRIYTLEEKELNNRSCIIGSDVQIPNSIVRYRLGTRQMSMKANIEILRKAFELPDELFMNLSLEHKIIDKIEEEKLTFEWDDDDDTETKRKKSVIGTIINKQREKRRKLEDYKYDYDNIDPLPLNEIIEEIRTNIGKDLKNDDLKLITELMQIISRYKQDQVMNIYDELTDIHLINKFGGVPKLVQALQEIQKAFEQVAMKTNIVSIETVIDVLLEKDNTYRIAVELLSSFNENMKKNKQQQQQNFNLNDKSGKYLPWGLGQLLAKILLRKYMSDISEYDQTLFNILIKDRISRLPTSDLTTLINDLKTIRNIDTSKLSKDHDDRVKFLSEQLNIIFTRAHFDGIKTVLQAMKSSISLTLTEFIDKIENSLKFKLTNHENLIIESYIQDHLTLLNDNELKTIYEHLAQQGTLKRHTGSTGLNQTITMGLMKKIDMDGLGIVIENMKEAHLDIDSINELIQELIRINHYIQTQPSISIEQIQNQLTMAYFIETRHLTEQDIEKLSQSANLYSMTSLPPLEAATKDECSVYLEHFKGPFIRICIQRILNLIEENPIHLNKVSNQFYNERIIDLLNELIHGSEELNGNLLFHQLKEQLKKNKDLSDKLYRQMLKEKLLPMDTKIKIDTEKKKISMIINEVNRIIINKEDRIKKIQLMELFDRIDLILPERIKRWYKTKSAIKMSSSKLNKGTIDRKINDKVKITGTDFKAKSVLPTRRTTNKSIGPSPITLKQRLTQETRDQLPTIKGDTSSKYGIERKRPLVKSQTGVHRAKEHSKILDYLSASSQITLKLKSEEHPKNTSVAAHDQPIIPSTTTITTGVFTIDNISKLQVDSDFIEDSQLPIASLPNDQERDNQPSNTGHIEFESFTNTSTSDTLLNNMQPIIPIDSDQKTNEQFDVIQQQDNLHEKYFENDDTLFALTRIEMSQTDLENIQREIITSGTMGENKAFNFEIDHDAALLFYHPPLSSDQEQKINISLTGKTAEFVNDAQYEKTKAQRILAKTIPSSNIRQQIEGETIVTSSSSSNLIISDTETISATSNTRQLSGPPADDSLVPISIPSLDNIKSSSKVSRRTLNKSIKQTEDIYINSLTNALRNLFSRSEYDSMKLRKIHEELISSGHISPLNEFYRSSNEALRVTLDHCLTYNDLMKWTLSLLQTNNKPNLIDFGHDLYSIAIDLDLTLIERIDNARLAIEIQEHLKHELQTITEIDLREINSYLNASQLEKLVNLSKKLNVTSKDRMISDLNSLLLHLIQAYHTFQLKYRPMQTRLREIAETFKSRAIADLARKMDEIEKRLSKTYGITLFGVSKRMNESRFILTK